MPSTSFWSVLPLAAATAALTAPAPLPPHVTYVALLDISRSSMRPVALGRNWGFSRDAVDLAAAGLPADRGQPSKLHPEQDWFAGLSMV